MMAIVQRGSRAQNVPSAENSRVLVSAFHGNTQFFAVGQISKRQRRQRTMGLGVNMKYPSCADNKQTIHAKAPCRFALFFAGSGLFCGIRSFSLGDCKRNL